MGSSPCPPRFVCLFGGGNGKGKHEPDDAAQYMMIIAPREVIYFMAYITVNSVVNILNGVIYYVWWLRMKAKGYKLVKRPARRPLRSPEPYQRYHHTNADDDDMGDWD